MLSGAFFVLMLSVIMLNAVGLNVAASVMLFFFSSVGGCFNRIIWTPFTDNSSHLALLLFINIITVKISTFPRPSDFRSKRHDGKRSTRIRWFLLMRLNCIPGSDTQHNDIQHNITQFKGIICDIQQNGTQHNSTLPLRWMSLWWVPRYNCYAKCHYAECHNALCRYAECRGAREVGDSDKSGGANRGSNNFEKIKTFSFRLKLTKHLRLLTYLKTQLPLTYLAWSV